MNILQHYLLPFFEYHLIYPQHLPGAQDEYPAQTEDVGHRHVEHSPHSEEPVVEEGEHPLTYAIKFGTEI